jgi:two-component system phosphate regulon sensor histidine kinase PhoR
MLRDAHASEPEVFDERDRDTQRATSEFVATLSHELRTPLANILGYVEVLQDLDAGPLLPEQARLIDVVERNGRRLLSLIENLLTVSTADNGTFVVKLAPVDTTALAARAHGAVSTKVAHAGLRFEGFVGTDLPSIEGDAAQLEHALLNVVGNAIKFTPQTGTITLRIEPTAEGRLRFAVTDDGLGIPRAECDKIFNAFFRSSVSQERATEGTGLGLYIVKLIVEGHGGRVGASSTPDDGTTVWFTIPAVCAH